VHSFDAAASASVAGDADLADGSTFDIDRLARFDHISESFAELAFGLSESGARMQRIDRSLLSWERSTSCMA
jgi:hypothetical protein